MRAMAPATCTLGSVLARAAVILNGGTMIARIVMAPAECIHAKVSRVRSVMEPG